MRVFNFSAGPAMLPTEVMERAAEEFCDFKGMGSGVCEISHRSPEFAEVIESAESRVRSLMSVPEGYSVLFIQGGASMQFAMIPMNLMLEGSFAEYADTGSWSAKAMKEAAGFGEPRICASSREAGYTFIPEPDDWNMSDEASYLHITSNNTIAGTQYHFFPDSAVPLIADMSSDILSRQVDVSRFGLIYAGAQKNIGPSGVALVVLRKDLLERSGERMPTMLNYNTYVEKNSMFNTPPTFAIYMIGLVLEWLENKGGILAVEEINDAKSEALYEAIDSTDFYRSPVRADSRSKMNVVFRLPEEDLEKKFISEAADEGLVGLKGHRSVGGIRASIYNAMPLKGIELLIDFMAGFEKKNG